MAEERSLRAQGVVIRAILRRTDGVLGSHGCGGSWCGWAYIGGQIMDPWLIYAKVICIEIRSGLGTNSSQRCFPTDELGLVLDSHERLLISDLLVRANIPKCGLAERLILIVVR